MNLIFLGPPGAGKGTQAVKISKKYNIPHISTGNILRAAIAQETEMGLAAKKHIDAGNLVPDEVVVGIVKERLGEEDCKKGYLLDGFPRTLAQAHNLSEFADIDLVIFFDVDDKLLIKRISSRWTCSECSSTYDVEKVPDRKCLECGGKMIQRIDDTKETATNRIKVYHELTSPLVEYYEENGLLCKVDGRGDIDVIFDVICDILGEI